LGDPATGRHFRSLTPINRRLRWEGLGCRYRFDWVAQARLLQRQTTKSFQNLVLEDLRASAVLSFSRLTAMSLEGNEAWAVVLVAVVVQPVAITTQTIISACTVWRIFLCHVGMQDVPRETTIKSGASCGRIISFGGEKEEIIFPMSATRACGQKPMWWRSRWPR